MNLPTGGKQDPPGRMLQAALDRIDELERELEAKKREADSLREELYTLHMEVLKETK